MHLKRNKTPKSWPIERKGTKYLVVPQHNLKNGIPLLVALRDILNFAQNRKEAKKILSLGKVKVNGKIAKEEKQPLLLFDVLSIGEKNFRVVLENKKFSLMEIQERETLEKIAKIIGKKILKGGKIQINLSDGRNFITKESLKTGNSVIVDFKERKIKKIIEPRKGGKMIVLKGRHSGKSGKIVSIEKNKSAMINFGKEKASVKLDNLIAIE